MTTPKNVTYADLSHPTREEICEIVLLLHEYFPQGLVAGGAPRDYMTGEKVKDVDFWLPKDVTAEQVYGFARAVRADHISTFDATTYGMIFDEERIDAIYQLKYKDTVIDMVVCKFNSASEAIDTFMDTFSQAVAFVLDGAVKFKWVTPVRGGDLYDEVALETAPPPYTLEINGDRYNDENPRHQLRLEKLKKKHGEWQMRGFCIHA